MTQQEFDFGNDFKIEEITTNITISGDSLISSNTQIDDSITIYNNMASPYYIDSSYQNTTSVSGSPYILSSTGWDTITLDSGLSGNTLSVDGDAEIKGDLKIQGKSIIQSLEKIEEKLAILNPNKELEERWESLRELRRQYMELEKEIIEKEKVWDIIKK